MTATEMARQRRRRSFFFEKFPRGKGIDIGCGPVALNKHVTKVDIKDFPGESNVVICDATTMTEFKDETFDYVYSSHCLEHLDEIETAIWNWYRILKHGGYLIIVVPHRDYYERKLTFPSNNKSHKFYFLPFISEAPCTISLYDLIVNTLENPKIVYLNECCEISLPYRNISLGEIKKLQSETGAQQDFSIETVIQKKIYTPIFKLRRK